MKNYQSIFLSCLFIYGFHLNAQKQQTIYVEGLGNGFAAASLNYDFRFAENDLGFGVRVGYAYGSVSNYLAMGNYLLGSKKHKLEIGIGLVHFAKRLNDDFFFRDIQPGIKPTANLSYRLHVNPGIMFKIGWTPILDSPINGILTILPGLGLGWRFN